MPWTKTLRRFLTEVLWPWFRDHIWPLIREQVINLVNQLIAEVKRRMEEWLACWQQREEEAYRKAKEAEAKAAATSDPSEADKHRRIAEIWREVAENFRQDNEALRMQLTEVLREAENLKAQLQEGPTLESSEQSNAPALILAGRPLALPEPLAERRLRCPNCNAELSL